MALAIAISFAKLAKLSLGTQSFWLINILISFWILVDKGFSVRKIFENIIPFQAHGTILFLVQNNLFSSKNIPVR